MKPEITYGEFCHIEDPHGETTILPLDSCGGWVGCTKTYHTGWYCRLSAPGYLDSTEWSGPFESEEEAMASLVDTFDLDDCEV